MQLFSQTTETFGNEDHSWLRSQHGTEAIETAVLDLTKFTKGTHYPDGYIKSGEPLGKITATGLYGPYDGAASDGRETLVGHLFTTQAVRDGGGNVVGALITHGKVVEDRLPHPVDAAGKADVAGSIRYV